MANLNGDLNKAKRAKNDEWYTQLADIENELKHYKDHFRGKIVYCNCDDPLVSNFYLYFALNFEALGLKGLRATCYRNSDPNSFGGKSDKAVWLEYTGGTYVNGAYVPGEPAVTELQGDGDFRSEECRRLLDQADIVVTNPPFSLFREYMAHLVESGKQFLILGNMNAITYKEIFPLIQAGKLWMGAWPMGREMLFDVPEDRAIEMVATGREGSRYRVVGGVVKGRQAQCVWFTNMDHAKRHEDLILYREYSPEAYPKYDNYDAIEVSKVKDIPRDYDGFMGVPITFLDKWNPEQFEIVGQSRILMRERAGGGDFTINRRIVYMRVVVRRRRLAGDQ